MEDNHYVPEKKSPDPVTAEMLHRIGDDEWLVIFNALVIYACKRCSWHRQKKLFWRTGMVRGTSGSRSVDEIANLPKGFSPEAIAQEAVARVFRGDRAWNHVEYPGDSPIELLKGIVDSIVGELLESQEHQRATYIEDEQTGRDTEGNGYKKEATKQREPTLLDSAPVESPEQLTYMADVLRRVRECLSGRPDLASYFELHFGGSKRAEIAKEMGLPPERVTELRKQFLERTADIYKELLGMPGQKLTKRGRRKAQ